MQNIPKWSNKKKSTRTLSERGTSQHRYGRVSSGLGGYKCHLFSPEGDSDEAMEGWMRRVRGHLRKLIVLTWNDLPKVGKRYSVVGSDSKWSGDGGCVYMCRCTRVCVCVCVMCVCASVGGWSGTCLWMSLWEREWRAVIIVKIVYCDWKALSWSWKHEFQYDDSGATGLWFPKHLCQLRLPTRGTEQQRRQKTFSCIWFLAAKPAKLTIMKTVWMQSY